jgi:cyclopropane fatty-acyl-phospholipid synthase-like methyltransferase
MNKVISEDIFSKATDEAFRVRTVSEYRRVRHVLGQEIDFDSARILDFGCGQGFAAASFALRHPKAEVIGFDVSEVDQKLLQDRLQSQLGTSMPANLSFVSGASCPWQDLPKFELVYSWSVFEHIRETLVEKIFAEIKAQLSDRGKMFLQIDPLYFSPKGSHLYKYFSSPWHHLMLSLDQLMETVFKPGGNEVRQQREWQQFVELNRLTATDFLGRARSAGFKPGRTALRRTQTQPPQRLLRIYSEEALLNEELVTVLE